MKRIVITGGTGFLGQALAKQFAERNWEVILLSRSRPKERVVGNWIQWDGKTQGTWSSCVDSAEAVANLAGKSVNCRYHKRNKEEILKSRTNATNAVANAINNAKMPPKVWVNAASATIYADSRETPNTETDGEIGTGFSVSVCRAWEESFFHAETPGTRKVALRTSFVLGWGRNSALGPLTRLAKFRLGGKMGNGEQMMSWIHQHDFTRAVQTLIENEDHEGIYNITGPAPVRNDVFMKTLRDSVGVKLGLPSPAWLLKVGMAIMRTEPELVLKSRYVLPEKLVKNRFVFEFPFLDEALSDLVKNPPQSPLFHKSDQSVNQESIH